MGGRDAADAVPLLGTSMFSFNSQLLSPMVSICRLLRTINSPFELNSLFKGGVCGPQESTIIVGPSTIDRDDSSLQQCTQSDPHRRRRTTRTAEGYDGSPVSVASGAATRRAPSSSPSPRTVSPLGQNLEIWPLPDRAQKLVASNRESVA